MIVNTKKFPLKVKKIPYYLALVLLTAGASLILGFLSFGGMYAFLPILPLAFTTFGLAVAYEGEIYLQNIKGAFKKLFKSNYLENHLAKEYLLKNFPQDTHNQDCPKFFKDYEKALKLLNELSHIQLDKESKKRKKQIEKTLTDMEKWFALQLLAPKKDEIEQPSEYASSLRMWLEQHEQSEFQVFLEKRQSTFKLVKAFSLLAATFMGFGSTYLMTEAFSIIPLMAAIPFTIWPMIIVPMALIAGIAYGMLTYNTATDLINNDTLNIWYNKIRNNLRQELTLRNVFATSMTLFLVALAIALTICTAGTWWTIATNARPLFEWMKKMPSFIMGIIHPLITGLSAIFFNIQNTAESLKMVDTSTHSEKNIFHRTYDSIVNAFAQVYATENWLQIFNPFRLILKLTLTPLKILLFFGHLLSMALTSDRVPGLPQIIAVLIAIISEGFEDAHYFLGHGHNHQKEEQIEEELSQRHDDQHQHHHNTKILVEERLGTESSHNHDTDIPTQIIEFLALPIYALAASWDCLTSKIVMTPGDDKNTQRRVLTFSQAWHKQLGIQEEVDSSLSLNAKYPSAEWKVEHTVSLIEKYQRKHFNAPCFDRELAYKKQIELKQLKSKIRESDIDELHDILLNEKDNPCYNQHRLFAVHQNEKTTTQIFIEELSERVNAI